jgi:hypothetical protein
MKPRPGTRCPDGVTKIDPGRQWIKNKSYIYIFIIYLQTIPPLSGSQKVMTVQG